MPTPQEALNNRLKTMLSAEQISQKGVNARDPFPFSGECCGLAEVFD